MGCTQDRNFASYDNPYYPEEKQIRDWENNLGLKDKIFFDIVSEFNQKIFLDGEEITRIKLNNFLTKSLKNYNLINIFDYDFFNSGHKNKIDCKYVKLFFLLLCQIDKISNSDLTSIHQYFDKVEYLLSYINDGVDQELKRGELELLLEPLFIISCVKLPMAYIKSREDILNEEESYLFELKDHIDNIKEVFFFELFGKNNKEVIELKELNEIVALNPFILSSGFIREVGLKIIKKNK